MKKKKLPWLLWLMVGLVWLVGCGTTPEPQAEIELTEVVAQLPTVVPTALLPTDTAVLPITTPTPTPTLAPPILETYDLSLAYTPTPTATPQPLATLDPTLPPPTGQIFMVWDPSSVDVIEYHIEKELFSPHHQYFRMIFDPLPTIMELDFNTQPKLAYPQMSEIIRLSPDQEKIILTLMTDTNDTGEIEVKGYETDNKVLYLYDLETHVITPLVITEEMDISSVAWLPDSQSIFYPQQDKLILYQLQSKSREIVLQVPDAYLTPMTLSPNGEVIALRASPPQVIFYNTVTKQIMDTIDEFRASLFQSSFWSADSQWLAMPHAHYGRQEYRPLSLYNIATQQIIPVAKPEDRVSLPAWAPDGQQLAFTRNRNSLSLWSRETLTSTDILTADYVSAPMWEEDQQLMVGVVGDNGSQIVILDVNTGEQESWSLNLGYEIEEIRLLRWSPDKNWLAFIAMGETGTSSGVYLIPRGGGETYQVIDMLGYETVSHFEWFSDSLIKNN